MKGITFLHPTKLRGIQRAVVHTRLFSTAFSFNKPVFSKEDKTLFSNVFSPNKQQETTDAKEKYTDKLQQLVSHLQAAQELRTKQQHVKPAMPLQPFTLENEEAVENEEEDFDAEDDAEILAVVDPIDHEDLDAIVSENHVTEDEVAQVAADLGISLNADDVAHVLRAVNAPLEEQDVTQRQLEQKLDDAPQNERDLAELARDAFESDRRALGEDLMYDEEDDEPVLANRVDDEGYEVVKFGDFSVSDLLEEDIDFQELSATLDMMTIPQKWADMVNGVDPLASSVAKFENLLAPSFQVNRPQEKFDEEDPELLLASKPKGKLSAPIQGSTASTSFLDFPLSNTSNEPEVGVETPQFTELPEPLLPSVFADELAAKDPLNRHLIMRPVSSIDLHAAETSGDAVLDENMPEDELQDHILDVNEDLDARYSELESQPLRMYPTMDTETIIYQSARESKLQRMKENFTKEGFENFAIVAGDPLLDRTLFDGEVAIPALKRNFLAALWRNLGGATFRNEKDFLRQFGSVPYSEDDLTQALSRQYPTWPESRLRALLKAIINQMQTKHGAEYPTNRGFEKAVRELVDDVTADAKSPIFRFADLTLAARRSKIVYVIGALKKLQKGKVKKADWLRMKDFIEKTPMSNFDDVVDYQYELLRPIIEKDLEDENLDDYIYEHMYSHVKDGVAYGRGRRKRSRASVWIAPGTGQFTINDKKYLYYFNRPRDIYKLLIPMHITGTLNQINIIAKVSGGGVSGQSQAVQLALSRAIANYFPQKKHILRSSMLFRRDPREVERKKFGRKKARKSFQWVKR